MRLPLLAVALAAVAASAVPADAAYYPVCQVALTPVDASKSCTSGNNPVDPANRIVNVTVASGTVQATVQCFSYSAPSQTKVFTAGQRGQVSVPEYGSSCRATLTALAPNTAATAVSYFTPRLVQEPTP